MRRALFQRSHSARLVSKRARAGYRFRPRLEALEDRSLLATIVVNTFNDVIADDGFTSLREAIAEVAALAGDDTIELPAGTYPLSLGQLMINDASGQVTIESSGGAATIDAQFASRVLEVVAGSQVNLSGLVISGGFAADGAGILNAGTLSIEDGTVRFNFAFGLQGGGIYNNLGTLTISGTVLASNFALLGGAISNNSVLTISRSNLLDNVAFSRGGGIFNTGTTSVADSQIERNSGSGIHNTQNGSVSVENSLFAVNQASRGGGIHNNIGTVTVEGSDFQSNRASLGGGIYSDTNLHVEGTSLSGNTAVGGGFGNPSRGGGLFIAGIATIEDSVLEGNQVQFGEGGGIFIDLGATVAIETSTLSSNQVLFGDGGGIFNRGTLAIESSSLSTNAASFQAGGGLANFAIASLTDSIVTGNTAPNGGGIWNVGSLSLADSNVSGNTAFLDGGGIHSGAGSVSIADSTVSQNSASSGAGIASRGTLAVTDSVIENNQASFRGGGLLNSGAATIDGSTLSGNLAGSDSGGGIYSQGSFSSAATLLVTASTFRGNTSAFFGGGAFNGSQSTATVIASTFDGNASLLGGGIANFGAAALSVVNSTFSGNSAVFAGGGIYSASFDGSASLDVTSSTVSRNSSANGGGIFNFDAATIRNTIVALNSGSFGPDVSGNFTSSGYNLIGIGDGSTGFGATGDQVGTAGSPIDPLLGLLADNGGPTETMALLPGSPALNAGDPALAGTTDQRGVLRPQGPGVDIGAFELEYHTVDVVVKPGSDGGPINLSSSGLTPVAILGSADFDAASVDSSTVKAEDPTLGIQISPAHSVLEDTNGDGRLDLVLFFSTEELSDLGALDADSTALLLTGVTTEGLGVIGTASVRTVGGSRRA